MFRHTATGTPVGDRQERAAGLPVLPIRRREPAYAERDYMLTPFDDYPVHQIALPVAHAFGLYPNRGIIDAAFSVVHDGV